MIFGELYHYILNFPIKKTNLEKYGYINAAQNKEVKNKIKKGRVRNKSWISDDLKSQFDIYKNNVDNRTKLIKSKLIEEWDGNDYYDGEYIKDNFELDHIHKNYPTIDHKISIYYGFNNNIPFEEISDLDNLCITKKHLNSKKNRLTEKEFHEKYKS